MKILLPIFRCTLMAATVVILANCDKVGLSKEDQWHKEAAEAAATMRRAEELNRLNNVRIAHRAMISLRSDLAVCETTADVLRIETSLRAYTAATEDLDTLGDLGLHVLRPIQYSNLLLTCEAAKSTGVDVVDRVKADVAMLAVLIDSELDYLNAKL